jgi:NAD(P)-dependent dehydrogenase (short-subunit alcohol dehydrogenase family)
MLSLKDKVAVITGGGGLLGKEFAKGISACGGIAIIADLDAQAAALAASEVSAAGGPGPVDSVALDITSLDSVRAAIDTLRGRHGRIDALVNSAYPRNRNYGRKLEDVTYADFCENVGLQLGGYFLSSQQFGLDFKTHGGGRVVNLASIYGVMAPRFEVYEGASFTMPVEYACIKSALIHLTRYLAKYFMGTGVSFNCVSPGGIYDRQPQTFVENYSRHTASRAMLDRSDVTGTLLYLLSDLSGHVNGQNIVVDDGFSL